MRGSARVSRIAAPLVLLATLAALAGCSSVAYYGQAAYGELSLLAAARPIDDWLRDPATPEALKQRLRRAQAIRAFASRELALPDNRSYTRYADLRRPAVVWNVFAAPELSLELKSWCYPIFGCATYRGYFKQEAANETAVELRTQGYDVAVTGVPAYSTLGWFSDPLLNTFIDWPDAELARLIFHELAHQVVYAPGDTAFNEGFATAVEREGVRRWLASAGDDNARANYARFDARREDFVALLLRYRRSLVANYAGAASDDERRARKRDLFAALQSEYHELRDTHWDHWSGYDKFFAQDLNNAQLGAVAAYNDWVPAFAALLARSDDWPAFYRAVQRLADLPSEERAAQLRALAPSAARP
jgi:predicted aminopeptidase